MITRRLPEQQPTKPKKQHQKYWKAHPGVGTSPKVYLLHRKLRLDSFMNQAHADHSLAAKLRSKFGPDPVLIMGNWSAPMAWHHAPIRGKVWRDKFKHHGFEVYLIDEFRTSSMCLFRCEKSLQTFRHVPNLRHYQRSKNPTVKCHGLLRCTSESCKRAMAQYRRAYSSWLLNRDLAAVLNSRLILQSLCDSGSIPERFRRSTAITANASGTTPATKRPRKRRAAAAGDSAASSSEPALKRLR